MSEVRGGRKIFILDGKDMRTVLETIQGIPSKLLETRIEGDDLNSKRFNASNPGFKDELKIFLKALVKTDYKEFISVYREMSLKPKSDYFEEVLLEVIRLEINELEAKKYSLENLINFENHHIPPCNE